MKSWIFSIVLSLFFVDAFAQCSVCNIDPTCDTTPAYPTTCPPNLPNDTAQQPYEATLTFYLPQQFNITSPINATVGFKQLTIVGLSGMPPGLTWSAYDHNGNSQTIFYPNSNPPSTERICAKICGTPLVPGFYVITVSAVVVVTVPNFGDQTQTQVFEFPLTIHPNPSGNSAFSMSANTACGSLQDVDFDPVLVSGGSPLYEYAWDFGNGQTSTQESPAPVDYNVPGTYTPSLVTNIYKYKITEVTATIACEDDWCGDADEVNFPFVGCSQATPDPFYTINDGVSVVVSGDIETKTPVWSNLNIPLESTQIIISFTDADGISADDALGTGIINVTGVGTFPFSLLSPGGCSGVGVTGSITVGKFLFSTLSDSDEVTVYPNPAVNNIIATPDSVCVGDFTTLEAPSGFISYEWYKDTNVIAGVTSATYTTNLAGNYTVQAVDSNGCGATSAVLNFVTVAYPMQPLVLLGGPGGTQMTLDNQQMMITYQWFYNGLPIPGQIGTTYTAAVSGTYNIQATNAFGCTIMSEDVVVVISGINESYNPHELSVYPNPSQGQFILQMNVRKASHFQINILDVSGRKVFEQNLGQVYGSYAQPIDLTNYSKGLYVLELSSSDGEVFRQNLIIAE